MTTTQTNGAGSVGDQLREGVPTARLSGRYCGLRQLAPADYDWLYGVCMQPENLMTYRLMGIPPSPERFAALVWQGVSCQFVVTKVDRPMDRVGVVTFYGQNDHTQVASLAVVFHRDYWQGGWPWEGVVLAVDHFFRVTRTRKLCVEVAEWNLARLASLEALGLQHEGCLRDHEYVDGRYWDRHLYALFRDDWQRLRATTLRALGGPGEATPRRSGHPAARSGRFGERFDQGFEARFDQRCDEEDT